MADVAVFAERDLPSPQQVYQHLTATRQALAPYRPTLTLLTPIDKHIALPQNTNTHTHNHKNLNNNIITANSGGRFEGGHSIGSATKHTSPATSTEKTRNHEARQQNSMQPTTTTAAAANATAPSCASHDEIKRLIIEWIPTTAAALDEVDTRWEQRHWVLREFFSSGHQFTQRRMVLFWAIGNKDRQSTFNKVAARYSWIAKTREAYFATGLGVANKLGLSTTPEDKLFLSLLKRRAKASREVYPHGIRPDELWGLIEGMTECCRIAAEASYALAQRFSDFRRICAEDVTAIEDFVAITIRVGKTASRLGPHTVHLPREALIAQNLLALQATVKTGPLFAAGIAHEMSSALKAKGWTQPCMRRGALQELARAGAPTELMLYLSRHATVQMLDHYLQKGVYHLAQPIALAPYSHAIRRPQLPMVQPLH